MENNKQFTNEELSKKFKNNFDLVNYAISLAENMIQSGRDPRVRRTEMQNRAMLILEEIKEGKDVFVEIPEEGFKAQDSQERPRSHEKSFDRDREREKKRGFQESFDDKGDE
jgi:DNA-directed RNA polymerase subunit omega